MGHIYNDVVRESNLKGRREGGWEGIREGILNNQKQIYINLRNLKFPREKIKEALGVSEEALREIENSIRDDKKK
jgi:predicted transposase YdaD